MKIWQEKLIFFLITVFIGYVLYATIEGPIYIFVMGGMPLLYHLYKGGYKKN